MIYFREWEKKKTLEKEWVKNGFESKAVRKIFCQFGILYFSDIFSGLLLDQRKEILEMQQMHDLELLKNVNFELERLKMDNMLKQHKIELQLRHAQQLQSEKLPREYEVQVQRLKLIGEAKLAPEGAPSNESFSLHLTW